MIDVQYEIVDRRKDDVPRALNSSLMRLLDRGPPAGIMIMSRPEAGGPED